eukprot:gnl/Spiro4/10310_TR5495_c0_g1_i1.p1 gnl/Spiro4/10310_TR5495_c0_g1~~gnl/Spiro4/10310_TR5495_c0_g1_i1.p1  ORF type:complete len:441 (+),score=60.59 gnl/Spiro4/10310_TR5495_c0_g1_i1:159-1481(+)
MLPRDANGRIHVIGVHARGEDGSGSQSVYQQKAATDRTYAEQRSLVAAVVTPLRLILPLRNGENHIMWNNSYSRSPSFARPQSLQYGVRETAEAMRALEEHLGAQYSQLQTTELRFEECDISVTHVDLHTLVDGKQVHALTETDSSMTCCICGATSWERNNLAACVARPADDRALSFGLHCLHQWIRNLEWILHVAERLPVRSWQIRGDDKRALCAQAEATVKDKLRATLGIVVNQVKPGSGTTNDGNTARRFFANPKLAAECTGVDERLIECLHVLLQTVNTGYAVDINAFRQYGRDTATRAVALYPWFPIPTSPHKILIHGHQIAAKFQTGLSVPLPICFDCEVDDSVTVTFGVPIGMTSEEGSEAANKLYRQAREHHTRKNKRENTMLDVMHARLVGSDPVISTIRCRKEEKRRTARRRVEPLSQEVRSLLCVEEWF